MEGYQKFLQANSNDVEAHLTLGQLCMGDKQYAKEAVVHLKKVLELEPEHLRKSTIELWIGQLENQIQQDQQLASAKNAKARERVLAHLKSRLSQEMDAVKKKELEGMIQNFEKNLMQSNSGSNK